MRSMNMVNGGRSFLFLCFYISSKIGESSRMQFSPKLSTISAEKCSACSMIFIFFFGFLHTVISSSDSHVVEYAKSQSWNRKKRLIVKSLATFHLLSQNEFIRV